MGIEEYFDDKKCQLGFGFMRLPVIKNEGDIDFQQVNALVDEFMKTESVHYFETAYGYHWKNSETAIRKTLVERYAREDFVLTDKMPINLIHNSDDYEKIFAEQKKKCGVDFFDGYLLHNLSHVSYEKVQKTGGFEFLEELKKRKEARFVGFSFHDTAEVLDRILTENSFVDVVQLQINYLDWESSTIQSRKCYEVACKHHKPVFVMEPIKGGMLAQYPQNSRLKERMDEKELPRLALQFVASLENVRCVLSGMASVESVQENMTSIMEPERLTEDKKMLIKQLVQDYHDAFMVQCTNCRYCLDVCPQNINISQILSLYNECFTGLHNYSFRYYRLVDGEHSAYDCIRCGKCKGICSQHLEIPDLLSRVARNMYTDRIRFCEKIKRDEKYLVYGAGECGRKGIQYIQEKKGIVVGICDCDTQKQGMNISGITIDIPQKLIADTNWEKIVVFNENVKEIIEYLIGIGVDIEDIYTPWIGDLMNYI